MKGEVKAWSLRLWGVPALGGVELMHAADITHDYPRHVHEAHCLAVVLRGTETHTCRGRSHVARPGSLMLLNADEAHSSRSVGTEYRALHVRPQALERIASEVNGRDSGPFVFPRPVVRDPPLFRLLLKLHLTLEQNASPLEHESALVSALARLLARQTKPLPPLRPRAKEPRRVELVRDYLRSHYAENVSLARLASLANLSPFHLLRVFRERVGVPPHEYQTQLRVARARRLIHEGHTIADAAHDSGFYDQSHLSRHFKRIVGLTPGRYLSRSNIVQDKARRL